MRRALVLLLLAAATAAAVWLAFPRPEPPAPVVATPPNEPPAVGEVEPTALPQRSALPPPEDGAPGSETRARLVGRVFDALGQPLADCTVAFTEFDPERSLDAAEAARGSAQTGQDGRFTVYLEPHGVGVVTLVHRDFPLRVVRHRLAVPPGEVHDLGDLTLSSQPGLVVSVTARTGGAVAGAVVTATPAMHDVSLPAALQTLAERSAVTDSAGQAVLYGIDAGPYRVRVEAPQRAVAEKQHLHPENPPRAPHLAFVLDGGHTLRGRVTVAGAADLGRTIVRAEPVDGGPALEDLARPTGEFRLAGAQQGRYRVTVESVRFGSGQGEVEVPGAALTIQLDPGRTLRGFVRARRSGRAVAGALVVAEPEDGWPLIRAGEPVRPSARTGADGDFAIAGLPAGRFTLRVSSDAFVSSRFGPFAADAGPVELLLDAGVAVHGTLHHGGTPVAGAHIEAVACRGEGTAFALWRASHGERRQTTSGPDGAFDLAGLPVEGQRLIVVAEGCAQWLSPPLSGSEGDRLDLGTIQLVPEAILEGRAPPHARVCLDHTGLAGIAFTTEADGAGRYAFRGLPAGTYELSYHSAAGRKATIQPSKTSVTLAVGERRDLSSAH